MAHYEIKSFRGDYLIFSDDWKEPMSFRIDDEDKALLSPQDITAALDQIISDFRSHTRDRCACCKNGIYFYYDLKDEVLDSLLAGFDYR